MYGIKGKNKIQVSGLILQAAVSDRDFFGQDPTSKQHLELATQKLAEGKGKELMDRSVNFAPITYYRYHSFLARLGDDDMFSNDLTDEELESILGKIEIPTLIVQSLKDQYVPPHVDIAALGKRFVKAININKEKEIASLVLIEGADHSLTNPGCSQKFVEAVTKFLQTKELVGRQE
jgi:pimeloyl-ACP methyl ester carboxylesterase